MNRALLLASVVIGAALLPLGAASAADVVRPFVQPFDWTGLYIGLHAGHLNGDVTIHEDGNNNPGGNISGPVWGALAGYNFAGSPIPGATWGLEADIGKASAHGTGLRPDACSDYLYDLNWDAHFRARLGFPQGNFMPFVAAGLAVADLDITEGCDIIKDGGRFVGGTVGGGIDFMIAPQAFLRGEVLYDFYGNKQYEDFSADFNAWTARVALAFRLP